MEVLLLLMLMLGCGLLLSYTLFTWLVQRPTVYCKSDRRLDGKVAIVTGGGSGIGRAVALDLARRGATVYITSRNDFKGRTAAQYIQQHSKNPHVYYSYLELTDFHSIKNFVKHIVTKEASLDILINNAGIGATHEEVTKDGNDMIFTTNYLGHFLLTYLLLDYLKISGPSRIINTSSMTHIFVKSLDMCVLDAKKGDVIYPHLRDYDASKLALVLHAKELSRRLAGSHVTANSVSPGLSMTNFWFSTGPWWPSYISVIARCILRPRASTPEQAAQTTIYCAVSEDLEGISGKYYERCELGKESAITKDSELAAKLWDVSLLLTGCCKNGKLVDILPKFRYLDEEEMWQKKIQRLKASQDGKKTPTLAPETLYPITRS